MAKANYSNYHALEHYLRANDIEYEKLSAHHYRILGACAIVDVWPARMTCHVIQTESVDPNRYFRLSYHFSADELTNILEGGSPSA